MKVTVIGSGYVGLVTGACLAEVGNDITCVDIDANKVKRMADGEVPIYEPGLDELFHKNSSAGRLHFTTDLATGVADAAVIFLCLPTPPNEDGSADLSAVYSVAGSLGPLLTDYAVVVDKSTVPVGTAEGVKSRIAANTSVAFDVVSNPEFLREGFAIKDFMHPDRIVIGTSSERAKERMSELYKPFVTAEQPIYFMDEPSAEMTKYAANSFLVAKISFINEIANLCELVGANVDSVREAIGADPRIGGRFLYPGIGYGGSCFPKDVRALQTTAEANGYHLRLLEAAMSVNSEQQHRLLKKLMAHYNNDLSGKTFALWGLAFKPDTDDIREAPSLIMIDALLQAGAQVQAYDPEAADNVRARHKDQTGLHIVDDPYEALDGAEALLIATEWQQFKDADLAQVKKRLAAPVVFDGRNIYNLDTMDQQGITYYSIGRAIVGGATS